MHRREKRTTSVILAILVIAMGTLVALPHMDTQAQTTPTATLTITTPDTSWSAGENATISVNSPTFNQSDTDLDRITTDNSYGAIPTIVYGEPFTLGQTPASSTQIRYAVDASGSDGDAKFSALAILDGITSSLQTSYIGDDPSMQLESTDILGFQTTSINLGSSTGDAGSPVDATTITADSIHHTATLPHLTGYTQSTLHIIDNGRTLGDLRDFLREESFQGNRFLHYDITALANNSHVTTPPAASQDRIYIGLAVGPKDSTIYNTIHPSGSDFIVSSSGTMDGNTRYIHLVSIEQDEPSTYKGIIHLDDSSNSHIIDNIFSDGTSRNDWLNDFGSFADNSHIALVYMTSHPRVSTPNQTDAIFTDFIRFGFTGTLASDDDKIADHVVRIELEETGNNTGIFEGNLSHNPLNQDTLFNPSYLGSLNFTGQNAQLATRNIDSFDVKFLDQTASQNPAYHTGVVSFDQFNYRATNDMHSTVTVSVNDPDLDLTPNMADLYTVVTTEGDPAIETVGRAGLPTTSTDGTPLSFGPLGEMFEITVLGSRLKEYNIVTEGTTCEALANIFQSEPPVGLIANNFELLETGASTGVFSGSFLAPDFFCPTPYVHPDDYRETFTSSGSNLDAIYTDFNDEDGNISIQTATSYIDNSSPTLSVVENILNVGVDTTRDFNTGIKGHDRTVQGDVSHLVTSNASTLDISSVGQVQIEHRLIDSAGNISRPESVSRTLNVVDLSISDSNGGQWSSGDQISLGVTDPRLHQSTEPSETVVFDDDVVLSLPTLRTGNPFTLANTDSRMLRYSFYTDSSIFPNIIDTDPDSLGNGISTNPDAIEVSRFLQSDLRDAIPEPYTGTLRLEPASNNNALFRFMVVDLDLSMSDLRKSLVDTRLNSDFNGFNLVNYDIDPFFAYSRVTIADKFTDRAGSSIHIVLLANSDVMEYRTGQINPNTTWLRLATLGNIPHTDEVEPFPTRGTVNFDATQETLNRIFDQNDPNYIPDDQNIAIGYLLSHEESAATSLYVPPSGFEPMFTDFVSYGFSGDGSDPSTRVANQIIRTELLESSETSFTGTIHYTMLNNTNILDLDTYINQTHIGQTSEFFVFSNLTGDDAPMIHYGSASATDDIDAASTATISFDKTSYGVGDTVIVTLADSDLNTDQGTVQTYTVVSEADPAIGTIGRAGQPVISDIPFGVMMDIRFGDDRWTAPSDIVNDVTCMDNMSGFSDDVQHSLYDLDFELVETGVQTGVFTGTFVVPDVYCKRDGAVENGGFAAFTAGTTMSANYVDFVSADGTLYPSTTASITGTENAAPVISLNGHNPQYVEVNGTYTEHGASSFDKESGDISSRITIVSDLDLTTLGSYTVTYSVQDLAGQTSSATRTVIVQDTTPPLVTINGDDPLYVVVGQNYTDSGATVSDNYDVQRQITGIPSSVDTSSTGQHVITYTAQDAAGNSAISATRVVFVILAGQDGIPSITLLGNNPHVIEATPNSTYADPGHVAYDSKDGDITSSVVIDSSTVQTDTIGNYVVRYTVTDSDGISFLTTRDVSVQDTTPPTITLNGENPQNITLDATYVDSGATLSDTIDSSPTLVVQPSTIDTSIEGSYLVAYTGTDASGNSATITRTVNVISAIGQLPSITLTGDNPQFIEIKTAYTELGATASDSEDGTISDIDIDASRLDTNVLGTYTVQYMVSDSDENTISVSRDVIVRDTTPPLISLIGSDTVNILQDDAFTDPGIETSDNSERMVITFTTITNSNGVLVNSVDTGSPDTYTITYTAHDQSRNYTTVSRTVNVISTNTAPIIALDGDNPQFVEVHGVYAERGARAFDAEDGDISSSVVITSSVDTATLGNSTLTYTIQDSEGESASTTRTVTVLDTTPPVITITGDNPLYVMVDQDYADSGATLDDNYDTARQITGAPATIATGTISQHVITYSDQDTSGNTTIPRTRAVSIIPTESGQPPVITVLGQNPHIMDATPNSIYADPGVQAFDPEDNSITSSIVIDSSAVQTDTLGNYVVRYTVTDSDGISVLATRDVSVQDTTPPTITLNGENPLNLAVGDIYTDPGATISDAIDSAPTLAIQPTTIDTSTKSSYLVTYTGMDASGNTATATRMININSASGSVPTITLNGDNPQYMEINDQYTESDVIATDAEDGAISGIMYDVSDVDTTRFGTYVVIYTVSDSTGNTISISRDVIVQDTTPPVLTLNTPETINLVAGDTFVDPGVQATDNSGGEITIFTQIIRSGGIVVDQIDTSSENSFTIMYGAHDESRNFADTVFRSVHISSSNTPPFMVLNGSNPQLVPINTPYIEYGARAFDVQDGDLSSGILVAPSNIDTSTIGDHTITYAVQDSAGESVSLSRIVSVRDVIDPIITLNGTDPLYLLVDDVYVDSGAILTDDVDSSRQILGTPATIDTSVPGTHIITYTAQDSSNNLAITATRAVSVIADAGEPPVIGLAGDDPYIIEAAPNSTYTDPGYIANDSEDGNITSDVVIDSSAVQTDTPGNYIVRYEVTDSDGIAVLTVRNVHVRDTTPPTITLNGENPLNIALDTPYVDFGATTSDTIDSSPTLVVQPSTIDTSIKGSYLVTYSVTDSAGNFASVARMVNVNTVSNGLPIITLTGANPQYLEIRTDYAELGASATDAEDGAILDISVDSSNVHTTVLGTYNVIYGVTDSDENIIHTLRSVIVRDTTPPQIQLLGVENVNLVAGQAFVDTGIAASDNSQNTVTTFQNIVNSDGIQFSEVDTSSPDTFIISYGAHDQSNLYATPVSRIVNVSPSNAAPIIHLNGDIMQTVEADREGVYVDPGVARVEDEDDINVSSVDSEGFVNLGVLGDYIITYTVRDSKGLPGTIDRLVSVVDTTVPTITLNGLSVVVIDVDASYTEEGAIIEDNLDPDRILDAPDTITNSDGTVVSSVDTSAPETFTLTYTASDSSGLGPVSVVRTVIIRGTDAPTLVITGDNPFIVEAGSTYTEPGAGALDNENQDITDDIMISDLDDLCIGSMTTIPCTQTSTIVGDYRVQYYVEDSAGRPATDIRIVRIDDSTPPTIEINGPGSVTVEAGSAYTDEGATAMDLGADISSDIDVTITINDNLVSSLDTSIVGVYTITYSIHDMSGNGPSVATRTVNVVDTTDPTIQLNVPAENPQRIEAGSIYHEFGATAMDLGQDISNMIEILVNDGTRNIDSIDTRMIGTYTITYSVSDVSGNGPVSATRTVIISDTTLPTIRVNGAQSLSIGLDSVYVDEGATAMDLGQDISDRIIVSINDGTSDVEYIDTSVPGTYTITYTVSDLSGLFATASRIVVVCDAASCATLSDVSSGASTGGDGWRSRLISPSLILYNDCNTSVNGQIRIVTAVQSGYAPSVSVLNDEFSADAINVTGEVSPTQYITSSSDYSYFVFDGVYPNGVDLFWLRLYTDGDYLRGHSHLVYLPDSCSGHLELPLPDSDSVKSFDAFGPAIESDMSVDLPSAEITMDEQSAQSVADPQSPADTTLDDPQSPAGTTPADPQSPAGTTPADPQSPAGTTPADPQSPSGTTPADPQSPAGTIPDETIPDEPTLDDPQSPAGTIPDETIPDETIPDEPTLDDPQSPAGTTPTDPQSPAGTIPDETIPDETIPDEPTLDDPQSPAGTSPTDSDIRDIPNSTDQTQTETEYMMSFGKSDPESEIPLEPIPLPPKIPEPAESSLPEISSTELESPVSEPNHLNYTRPDSSVSMGWFERLLKWIEKS